MNRASEILRDYLERRRSDADGHSTEALREENLRRMLRHVGAARQPSEQLEPRLLQAMLREGQRTAARRGRGWRFFSRPAWVVLAPAAALAAVAVTVTWHVRTDQYPTVAVNPPPAIGPSIPPIPRAAPHDEKRPVIGLVIMGDLQRRHPSEERWEPVDSGTKIEVDDWVSTGPKQTGSIVFRDTSVSSLLPNTTVQYSRSGSGGTQRPNLVSLARGEVWHVVEKGGPPFTVETSTAKAIVHGTEFGVAVDARGKTRLQVKTGKVELRAARASVMVAAGMQSAVLPGGPPALPLPITSPVWTALAKRGHSGTLRSVPLRRKTEGAPAKDPGERTLNPSPLPAAPAPVEKTSPPGDTSSSPSSNRDDGTAAQRPFSTSR